MRANKRPFENWIVTSLFVFLGCFIFLSCSKSNTKNNEANSRERILINSDWHFFKYASQADADSLIYDVRPEVKDHKDDKVADSKPTEAVRVEANQTVLKAWVLPTGNDFVKDPEKRHIRPEGNPGSDFPFVQADFDDSFWRKLNLPHDWGIEEPFQEGWESEVGGGMGRLASHGVAWYRKKLDISSDDAGKSIFLEIEGAMSYAIVWLNGNLVGGWPYGYNSWQVDLTPYIIPDGVNQLAIRIDNPPNSARWYPGGGLYRNVWLTKTNSVHVGQWGTVITTSNVSGKSAEVDLVVTVDNDSKSESNIKVSTLVYALDENGDQTGDPVARFSSQKITVSAFGNTEIKNSVIIDNPALWGPLPTQTPNLYLAVTSLQKEGELIDTYKTRFGIRSLEFNSEKGILVNGEAIRIQGVNQHHDLGALGAAFNKRAAERQLEILHELGCNAIRLSHNPPAPELLELTDRMGFLVVNEIFDVWERKKTPLDFHLIFQDWYEQDTRSFIRRDRNCPSVIMWSYGNEVGEQYTDRYGADISKRLHDIVKEEDPTRPTTASMNFAKPDMPFSEVPDVISLNYQGEGIRNAPAYIEMKGIHTHPLYPDFHEKYPGKLIVSSETASALSTRGTYLFPVYAGNSAPVMDGSGGDPDTKYVSSYELYTAPFGSSADKVFATQDNHPYVAGEFVWSGWDYIGEPTPYYLSRSSYCGIIDLAGFKKDRYFLYQARWRPELPMVHIFPHWNWPERVGEITPVHVVTTGDEVELFLNGQSLGRKKKMDGEYRLRWDGVEYNPGELKAIAYKNGAKWAEEIVKTTGEAGQLKFSADRNNIAGDGKDLSFITVSVCDQEGLVVPRSNNLIKFSIEGPGEIVATDNGDPSDLEIFSSHERKAFNGLALVIVKAKQGEHGIIKVMAESEGIQKIVTEVEIK
ncbi:MAG: beta-galactosidase GalB [Labilibaculum antarcticum]